MPSKSIKKPKETERGRPPETAPEGYVTLTEAARCAGVSYATAYKRAKSGDVRSRQAPNGTIFVLADDLEKVTLVERVPTDLPSVTVRVTRAQHKRWSRAAAASDRPLSAWLRDLADAAA